MEEPVAIVGEYCAQHVGVVDVVNLVQVGLADVQVVQAAAVEIREDLVERIAVLERQKVVDASAGDPDKVGVPQLAHAALFFQEGAQGLEGANEVEGMGILRVHGARADVLAMVQGRLVGAGDALGQHCGGQREHHVFAQKDVILKTDGVVADE